jgi:RNA polymerase sigma-70 factor (ECF subfamily)
LEVLIDSGGGDAEPDDVELLGAVAQGDHDAFRCLMARHMKRSLALAQRIVGHADDADEIVQEAFLRVWTSAPRWRPDGDARFTTWFYRVIVNLCLDRRRRLPFLELDDAFEPVDTSPSSLDALVGRQSRGVVAGALADLPPRQRAAISLYYFDDMTGPEVARILDLSLKAVESLLVRGRRALKRSLLRRGVRDVGDVI